MSKQWGNGYHNGQVKALRGAAEAIKQLQDRDVYAMAIVNKMMNTHHDKSIVEEVHEAFMASDYLRDIYIKGIWNGVGAGMFIETHPPMPKKAAIELLYEKARKNGWNG